MLLIVKKYGNIAGAGFQSKSKYMFGKVTVHLKLVEGDSAGTVTAFYVSKNIINQLLLQFALSSL